jgi:hypothetical protein
MPMRYVYVKLDCYLQLRVSLFRWREILSAPQRDFANMDENSNQGACHTTHSCSTLPLSSLPLSFNWHSNGQQIKYELRLTLMPITVANLEQCWLLNCFNSWLKLITNLQSTFACSVCQWLHECYAESAELEKLAPGVDVISFWESRFWYWYWLHWLFSQLI